MLSNFECKVSKPKCFPPSLSTGYAHLHEFTLAPPQKKRDKKMTDPIQEKRQCHFPKYSTGNGMRENNEKTIRNSFKIKEKNCPFFEDLLCVQFSYRNRKKCIILSACMNIYHQYESCKFLCGFDHI